MQLLVTTSLVRSLELPQCLSSRKVNVVRVLGHRLQKGSGQKADSRPLFVISRRCGRVCACVCLLFLLFAMLQPLPLVSGRENEVAAKPSHG